MDYETFKQEMTEDLKQRLYERGIEDVEMSFHNVEKANQHYESLTVRQEWSNVGVNFNIENAFAEYEYTGDYAGVLAESTHAIMQGLENVPSVDASELTNYEVMKEKLSIEVISAKQMQCCLQKFRMKAWRTWRLYIALCLRAMILEEHPFW